jgi:hypothetical protein
MTERHVHEYYNIESCDAAETIRKKVFEVLKENSEYEEKDDGATINLNSLDTTEVVVALGNKFNGITLLYSFDILLKMVLPNEE